ncbi:MAG: glycerol-3-phosphate 1-O-acyltransferase PlsY [Coriobacteriia bacterium]|jgi:glycerol-3-phosphate acyltransferase PlsY|nr:glycerol-3-phosphate 1-O-acyltransferase PlsY [Coriobacteriia bacterium]
MPVLLHVVIVLAVSYLLGAIPFAVIVGRIFFHVDIRTHGSGNAGATNVMRVLGVKAAIAVLALDMLKGAAAVCLAFSWPPAQLSSTGKDWVLIGAALAVVLGHMYSLYIGLGGGKGVATAAGAMLPIMPLGWCILLGTFIFVVVLSRMVSLGSIVMAAVFPVVTLALYPEHSALVTFSFVAAVLVIWRHRANIGRIVRGQEAKIDFRRPTGPGSSSDREDGA